MHSPRKLQEPQIHSTTQPYRLFQQNTPVPQQGWFTDKLRILNKRHRRRATHINSRLILSDIHQKATTKSFWWMSDVKKGEKDNTTDNAKQNLGFLCLHVNVSPLIVFQRWVFSDLKCCLHVDKRPQPISTNTHVYMELCVRVSSSHSRIGRTLLKLIFRDL